MDFTLETGVPADADTPRPAEVDQLQRLRWHPNPDQLDLLSTRLDELASDEQALVRALYLDQRTPAEIAPLLGMDERSVRRRAKRIADRVLSGEFAFVIRSRDLWPFKRRRVATAIFVRGLSLNAAAADLGLSTYRVRQERAMVLALYDASRALQRTGTGGR
jgi:hypothetical protein